MSNTQNTNITSGTIIRTILMILGLINMVLTISGHSIIEIEDATIETVVNSVFTIVTTLLAWWKNNSFTKNAIKADNYLNELKK